MFSHLAVGFIVFGLALILTDWRYSRRLKAEAERGDYWYHATQYWYNKFVNHIEYLERKGFERRPLMDDDDDSEEWKKR